MSIELKCNTQQTKVIYSGSKGDIDGQPLCVTKDASIDKGMKRVKDEGLKKIFEMAKANAEIKPEKGGDSPLSKTSGVLQAARDYVGKHNEGAKAKDKIEYPEALDRQITSLAKKNSPQQGVSEGPNGRGRDVSAFQPPSKDLASIAGGR